MVKAQPAEFCTFPLCSQKSIPLLGLATASKAGDYVDGGGRKWSKRDQGDQNQTKIQASVLLGQMVMACDFGSLVKKDHVSR
jgi:hypothetical protein